MNTLVTDLLTRRFPKSRSQARHALARAVQSVKPLAIETLESRTLLSGNPVIAILDTGLDYNDSYIRSHLWVNTGETLTNTADNDNNGFANDLYGWDFVGGTNAILDVNGHGTAIAKQVLNTAIATAASKGQSGNDIQVMAVKVMTSQTAVGGTTFASGIWTAPAAGQVNGLYRQNMTDGSYWTWVGPGDASGPSQRDGTWTWTGVGPAPVTTAWATPPANTPGSADWVFTGTGATFTADPTLNPGYVAPIVWVRYPVTNVVAGVYSAPNSHWTWTGPTSVANPPTSLFTPTTMGTWSFTTTGPGPGRFAAGTTGTPVDGPGTGTFVWTPNATDPSQGAWSWVVSASSGTSGGVTGGGNAMGTPSSVQTLADGINYAIKMKMFYHVNVVAINISMGGFSTNFVNDPALLPLKNAIYLANKEGIAITMGAGNGGNNNVVIPNYPANFSYGLLAVTASVNGSNVLSTFSNYGASNVQLGAIGENLSYPTAGTPTPTVYNGTEFAGATLAGAIAGMKDVYDGYSVSDVLTAIYSGVTPSASLQGKTVTGGVLNIPRAFAYLNNHMPVGAIESVGSASVTGYAHDAEQDPYAININVKVDGVTVASNVPANLARPDLNLNGNHGFSVSFPGLSPGSHTVVVEAIDYPTGRIQVIGTRTVVINLPQLLVTLNGNVIANNSTVNLGNILEGTNVQYTFVMKNTGNQTLTLSSVNIPAGFTLVKDVARSLAGGQSDTLIIAPPTVGGTQSGNIFFATNDPVVGTYAINLAVTASSSYVNNLYQALLGRDADAYGLAYWTSQLTTQKMTSTQVAFAIEGSTEYITNQVTQLYSTVLGRSPDTAGLNSWVNAMQHGTTFEQVNSAFLTSNEYYTLTGTSARGVVSGYYLQLLGRVADSAGLTSWSDKLITGSTRPTVVSGFYYSTEGLQAVVNRFYVIYLGRQADSGGLASWTNALANGLSQKSLIASLVGSQEFFSKP